MVLDVIDAVVAPKGEVVEVPDRRPAVFDGVITTKARCARSAPSW